MKKFLTCAIAAGAVLFASSSAFAAFTVDVGTTQPKIIKQGCERAGTITFTFPQNSKLIVGDTYNIMLQDKVTLCKTIDYVIGDSPDAGVYDPDAIGGPTYTGVVFDDGKIDGKSTGQDGVVDAVSADLGVGAGVITAPTVVDQESTPIKSTGPAGPGAVTQNMLYDAAGNDVGADPTHRFYFHVYGKTGSTELTVKVLGTVANDYIMMGAAVDNKLEIRLFNGKRYDDLGNVATLAAIMLPTTSPTGVTEKCYSPAITDEEPTVLNSLCIEVPSTFPTSQNCVQVRYDAKDVIGNTPCDFSNDFDIACIDPNAYKLVPCAKGFLGEIPLVATTQNNKANCSFVYENPGDSGYCSLPVYQGNRIVIESNKATFAPTSDKFLIGMESKTDGLYFSGMPAISTFDVKDNACARNTLNESGVRTWKYDEGDDVYEVGVESCEVVTPAKTYAVGEYTSFVADTDCSVAATSRVRKITQIANAFSVTSTAQVMLVDAGTMIYDSTEYTLDKVEAKIEFTLYKKPCGIAGVFPVTLGTFVKSCTEVGSTLGLFFPYFPAMGEAWWSGLVITNGSETAGDATCVLYDEAGNSASFKTGSIPAGGQKVILLDDTITLTPVKGTFDKTKKFSIKASTEFTNAAGLVVFGNGLDGQGVYKPYLGNEFSSVK